MAEQDSKSANDTFKAPSQKELISLCRACPRTFKRNFKEYQQDAGISVNWTKLTEEQYMGFSQWFHDRADLEEAYENGTKKRPAPKRYNKVERMQKFVDSLGDDEQLLKDTLDYVLLKWAECSK